MLTPVITGNGYPVTSSGRRFQVSRLRGRKPIPRREYAHRSKQEFSIFDDFHGA
jgi:hypothetical protein